MTLAWQNRNSRALCNLTLVGTELFREFREVSPKVWKGKVFVPDVNRVFSGTGTVKDKDTIVARGCLIGNMGCKSQVWKRVN